MGVGRWWRARCISSVCTRPTASRAQFRAHNRLLTCGLSRPLASLDLASVRPILDGFNCWVRQLLAELGGYARLTRLVIRCRKANKLLGDLDDLVAVVEQ